MVPHCILIVERRYLIKMNNIPQLMKKVSNIKYTKKEKKELIEQALKIMGDTKYLVICMEEISELIEVISDNINNKIDYIHTAEEIVDVKICIEIMKQIFYISDSKLEKVNKKKLKKNKSVVFTSLTTLSKAQQNISKCIRNKNGSDDKIISTLNNLNETVCQLILLFKIKEKDLSKIELLKYNRLEERIINGTLM